MELPTIRLGMTYGIWDGTNLTPKLRSRAR